MVVLNFFFLLLVLFAVVIVVAAVFVAIRIIIINTCGAHVTMIPKSFRRDVGGDVLVGTAEYKVPPIVLFSS